jgi:hypothetical protein
VRSRLIVLAVAIVAVVGVASADVTAGAFIGIRQGSYAFTFTTDGLSALPPDPKCAAPGAAACARRYAYSRDKTLTAWVSVRNDSAVPITLDGVPDRWFEQFTEGQLVRPVLAVDAGDPAAGWDGSSSTPFQPVVLKPGDQRVVGVRFKTSGDVAHACAYWREGTGVGLEALPLAWHWLLSRHQADVAFMAPFVLMAPTSEDCAR